MTGILGGFTTLSAFSLDVVRLFEAEKYLHAGSYILASIIFSLMAIFVGMFLMRVIIT
jgi:CrcB protein